MAGWSDPFNLDGTIGIEEEFFVVDDAGRPTGGTDELCYEHEPPDILDGRLDHELFTFVIETQTPIIDSLEEAPTVLSEVRRALVDFAEDHGYQIASAGLHPTARWRELEHVTKPRYRRQLERIQYPQHRNTTAGLHIHVGVGDGERAMWIANEIRWYLPFILALSVNSPFWNGFDTGLESARASIFETLPNTGMPPAYPDLETYADLEEMLLETDSIGDRGEIWFDVRPHTEYGTVEVRTPDAQRDEAVVLALTEYVVRLVEELWTAYDRLQTGEDLEVVASDHHADWALPATDDRPASGRLELLIENKWRAGRYGFDAGFIRRDGTGQVAFNEAARGEIDRLELARLPTIVDRESGAARQRRLLRENGVDLLCADLILDP